MLHIYRQITALTRVHPFVLTQKVENKELFPFDPLDLGIVPRPAMHFIRRFWYRQLQHKPWQISRNERDQLEGFLRVSEAQLLHVYFGHIAVHLLPLIRHWPKPTVVSFHGADALVELDNPHYRAATREMLKTVRLVLVRSESLARAVAELGCPNDKIRLQRTGIPLAEISFRERTWPENGEWSFLQAGRLIEKKGFDTSLQAFAEFQRQNPGAKFVIAGEGPLLESLRDSARNLGIADRVRFTGFLSQAELRREFYQAHIFLHPSELGKDGNQEGVPNAMLEAMASGLPVFATIHGGIPEAIENGVSGVLVKERDHTALATALSSWTRRPEEMTRLAQAGAASVAAKFNLEAQALALEEIYFELIAAGS